MDFNIKSCSLATLGNTGVPGCDFKLGMTKRLLVTDKDFYFDAEPTAATVQEAIQDRDLFPLSVAQEVEDVSTEKQMYEPASGESMVMVQSEKGIRVMLTLSPTEFRNLKTFDGRQFRIFEFDHLGNLIGTDLDGDGTKFAGFLTSEFSVENMTVPTDRTTPRNTPVFVKYADQEEYNTNLAVFSEMEFVNQVNGLLDVTMTVSDIATDGITLDVVVSATQKGVSGLDQGSIGDDLVILNSSGTPVVPSAVVESTSVPGRYAIAATLPAGDYTIDLNPSSDMVVEGYYSAAATSFTTA